MSHDDRGGQGFYRKRKRGYFRAYKRGIMEPAVVKFIHERSMKDMMTSVSSMFYGSLVDSITKSFGLMAIMDEEIEMVKFP